MTGRHYTVSTTLEPGKVTLIEFTQSEMRLHSFTREEANALANNLRLAVRNCAAARAPVPEKSAEAGSLILAPPFGVQP